MNTRGKNKKMDCNCSGEIGIVRNGDFYRIRSRDESFIVVAIFANHSARFAIMARVRRRSYTR